MAVTYPHPSVRRHPVDLPDRQGTAPADASLQRAAVQALERGWIRIVLAVFVSGFLVHGYGPLGALGWLLVLLAICHGTARVQRRFLAGETRLATLYVIGVGVESLWWCAHAGLLVRDGNAVSLVAAVMDLLSVTLFGIVGMHTNRRVLLATILPTITSLSVLLITALLQLAGPGMAITGGIASLVVSAAFVYYGLNLHRAERNLTAANHALAELSRRDMAHARFLTDVSEIADVGGWRWDPQDSRLEWSGAAQRIHDVPADYQPVGTTAIDFVRADHRQVFRELIAEALRNDERITADVPIITAAGRHRWVRISGRRHVEADGRTLLIGAIQDITERRATQDRLIELAEAAQAANRAKDGFLANMSHEIRTPLNGVIGLTAALLETPLDPRQAEMAELIHASGHALEGLVTDILDLSKIESGHLDLVREPFDLRQAIDTAAYVMRARAEQKGVGFRLHYTPAADGLMLGDAMRLRQIVSNLASNAVKFTDAGEVTVEVDMTPGRTGEDPHSLRIEVRDTGIGFDSAAQERLFQRFEQADMTITRQYGGSGLGLAICRALTERMGGTIRATSTPGEGSCFTVTLPLPRAPAGTAVTGPQTDPAPAALDRIRLLVAEDHPINRRTLCLMLDPFGIDITLAEDGAQALEAFRSGSFDAVLMDMQMPVMDGLAATRAIRCLEAETGRRRTPVIMLSANAMADHVATAREAGCDLHLAKPIRPDRLVAGLTEVLAARGTGAARA